MKDNENIEAMVGLAIIDLNSSTCIILLYY